VYFGRWITGNSLCKMVSGIEFLVKWILEIIFLNEVEICKSTGFSQQKLKNLI